MNSGDFFFLVDAKEKCTRLLILQGQRNVGGIAQTSCQQGPATMWTGESRGCLNVKLHPDARHGVE